MSTEKWNKVSRANPCPSCGKGDWCSVSADGATRICRRQAPAGVPSQEVTGAKGGGRHYRFRADVLSQSGAAPEEVGERVPVADVTTRHRVYAAVIAALGADRLTSEHAEQLRNRGFAVHVLQRLAYFSMPDDAGDRQLVAVEVSRALREPLSVSVPGFYREGEDPTVKLRGPGGLAIPVRDVGGRITAIRLRVVRDDGKKYLWLVGPKAAGTVGSSPGAVCHVPLHDAKLRTGEARVTEGEIKADLATDRTGLLTVSIPGVGQWALAIPVLRELGARRVRLAFDADAREKAPVALALQAMAAACAAEGWEVLVETWPSRWKGIDDAVTAPDGGLGVITTHAGAAAWEEIAAIVTASGETPSEGILARAQIDKLRSRIAADPEVALSAEAVEAAAALAAHASPIEFGRLAEELKRMEVSMRPWNAAVKAARRALAARREPDAPPNLAGLPQVFIGPEEADVADEVVGHLAASGVEIYQRAGMLVRVRVDDLGPRIEQVPRASVRELIARHVLLVQRRTSSVDGSPVERIERVNVPSWLAEAIASRGRWEGIRELRGITENAMLRADGTVLTEPGYDPASQLLLVPSGELPRVPERPTAADVAAAKALLLDVVCDFPFENEAHRATWLSALLVCFARAAIAGPTPLHAIDAPLRGAGKTLLAELIALILFGRSMPRRAYEPNAEEMKKTITSIAASNPAVVLFDNVAAPLAGAALDMVLTSDIIEDRQFGRNDTTIRYRTTTLWLASGNNLALGGDLIRRVLLVRLSSEEETPEARSGFRHPHLVEHVRRHRTQLAAAVLTLLRAYVVAGRPRKDLPAMGSFEAYTAVVRQTLVFHGLADPADSRDELVDTARSLLDRLITGWLELYPRGEAVTIGDVLNDLKHAERRSFTTLSEALAELGDGPLFKEGYSGDRVIVANAIGLAKRLGSHRDRVVGGRVLQRLSKRRDGVHWRVVPVGTPLPPGDGVDGRDGASPLANGGENISVSGNKSLATAGDKNTLSTVSTVTAGDEEFRP